MNADDKQRLKDAFSTMAKNVPDPDAPMIGFANTKMFSAKEAAAEVAAETPAGKDILAILEHGVQVEGMDKVVERLTRRAPKP